jgi:GH35 family endo-1,4-beta-xylanase
MLISNPGPTTEAGQFQSFINQYFNTIVPSNAGKWASNEANPPPAMPTMQLVDTQLAYAQGHNQKVRMHNLIWGAKITLNAQGQQNAWTGGQQPSWVNSLIDSAGRLGSASAKTSLSSAITNRINYYVGGTNSGNAQRSSKYMQVDVLNEALNAPTYWNIYGASGIASIYNQVLTAAAAAGNPNLRTLTNEYNVLQYSPLSIDTLGNESGADPYANWYRNQVDQLNAAGSANYGHNVVKEIGVELYANVSQTGSNALSTDTMQKALQNLSVPGLPISMNEFGMSSATNSQTLGPGAMDNAVRMIYGNPQADTFMVWGWWNLLANGAPPAQMIVTTPGASGYTLTPLGQEWVNLMNEFSTHVSPALSGGAINFNGYYGDYTVTVNGVAHPLTLAKGTTNYAILINPTPGDLDLDGKVTNADLQAELSALADPGGYEASTGLSAADLVTMGDVNGDHAFDVGDLGALMNLLSGSAGGGSTSAVPEPSTFLLYVLGGSTAALSLTVRNLRAHRSLCLKSIEAAATTH